MRKNVSLGRTSLSNKFHVSTTAVPSETVELQLGMLEPSTVDPLLSNRNCELWYATDYAEPLQEADLSRRYEGFHL